MTIYCKNCTKAITNADWACYSEEKSVYVCSLDCFTNYAYEELRMRPVDDGEVRS